MYKLKTSLTKISVDHSKEDQVESLFQKIKEEHKRLDILVNNAYAAVNYIMENLGTPFWEKDPAYSWDIVNNVGLRNNYICTSSRGRADPSLLRTETPPPKSPQPSNKCGTGTHK